MTIVGEDLIYGDYFRASDFGLVPGVFDSMVDGEEDTSLASNTVSNFLGGNPSSLYLSQNYSNNLILELSLCKNPCIDADNFRFDEQELRAINRIIEGQRGYQWLHIVSDGTYNKETEIWYYCRTNKIAYQRMGKDIIGINITFECNGARAYSEVQTVNFDVQAGVPFYIANNSDDLWQYVLPMIKIKTLSAGNLEIINESEDSRWTQIKNLVADETITMDCKHQILISDKTSHSVLLNDFNLNWLRLVPGTNKFVSNMDIKLTAVFRAPRKVGVI